MIVQADLERVFTQMRGDEQEVPYDSNFIAFVELQTQLMLEMRDTLNAIEELTRNQLITQNSIWEKLFTSHG